MQIHVSTGVPITRVVIAAALSEWEDRCRSRLVEEFHEGSDCLELKRPTKTVFYGEDQRLVSYAKSRFSLHLKHLEDCAQSQADLRRLIQALKDEWLEEHRDLGVDEWWLSTIGNWWDMLIEDLSISRVDFLMLGCWIPSTSRVFERMAFVRKTVYALSGAGLLLAAGENRVESEQWAMDAS